MLLRMYFRTIGCVVLLGAFLTGCGTIRNARNAQRESGDALPPGERSATPEEMGIRPGETLTLTNAVAIALRWNPSMVAAWQNLMSAGVAIHQAGAGQRPDLSSSVRYSESSRGPEFPDAWSNFSRENVTFGLSMTWTLYDFGQTKANRRRAVMNFIAAAESYRNTGIQQIASVRTAYFLLAQAEALYGVSQRSLEQYGLLLKQAELKLQIGTGIKYDVTKARVDYSNAELALINASNAVLVARAALNNQLGLATPASYPIESDIVISTNALPTTVEELLELARESQPSLMVSRMQVEAASSAVDAAIAALYPSLSVSAGLSYAAGQAEVVSGNWGVSLVQSLFSGWAKRNAVHQSVIALRTARANLAKQEQQMLNDVTSALANFEAAEQSRVTTEKLLEAAQENLDLVMKQFDLGMLSILDRSNAQLSFTQAAANRVNALYGFEIAKAKLYAIVGLVE